MNGYKAIIVKMLKKITPNRVKLFLINNITHVPEELDFRLHGTALASPADRATQIRFAKISRQIVQAGKLLPLDHPATLDLARLAHLIHQDNVGEIFRFKAEEASGDFVESSRVLSALLDRLHAENKESNQGMIRQLKRSPTYQVGALGWLPQTPPTVKYTAEGKKLLYILNNSLPQTSNGYATRSHGVVEGLQSAGLDLLVYTRPGFPLDWAKLETAPKAEKIDGAVYRRIFYPRLDNPGNHDYFKLAADAIEESIRINKPAAVMAASNYRNAFPALVAARRVGIPFIYEVRGFWEITRGSREPEFFDTAEFRAQELIESTTAREADMVLTLNEGMRQKLVERGVDMENIHLFPNSYDPDQFSHCPRDHALAESLGIPDGTPVIGYIGSFVDYEGLDDLVEAAAKLRQDGLHFRLLIVGGDPASPISEDLREKANDLGLKEWLIMPGRVPFETVPSYYSIIDISPFPRKPWPVCELVSPIKPVEAMAMGKALVVPSLPALSGYGEHGETVLIYEKGNTQDLAATLAKLVADGDLRDRMGTAGQLWAQQNMTWTATSAKAAALIRSLY